VTETTNTGNSFTAGVGHLPIDVSSFARDSTASEIIVTTLDDVVSEHVHLLKLDTQGHELRVLQGASQLLKGEFSARQFHPILSC